MKSKGGAALPEKEVQQIACQLRMGMDFLGDMGLAHRSLIPWHILVMHKDMRIKLTGFRKAVIYYNEKKVKIPFSGSHSFVVKQNFPHILTKNLFVKRMTSTISPADRWRRRRPLAMTTTLLNRMATTRRSFTMLSLLTSGRPEPLYSTF